jgi:hypothetical protein
MTDVSAPCNCAQCPEKGHLSLSPHLLLQREKNYVLQVIMNLPVYTFLKVFSSNTWSFDHIRQAMEDSHICFSINQFLPDIKTRFPGVVDMVSCLANVHSTPFPLCCVGGINICSRTG